MIKKMSTLTIIAEILLIAFGGWYMLSGLFLREPPDLNIPAGSGSTSENAGEMATDYETAEDIPEYSIYGPEDETAYILLPGMLAEDYYDGDCLDAVFVNDDGDSVHYYYSEDDISGVYRYMESVGDGSSGSVCVKDHIVNYRVTGEEDAGTGDYVYYWYSYSMTGSDNIFFIEMVDRENRNDVDGDTLRELWDNVDFGQMPAEEEQQDEDN